MRHIEANGRAPGLQVARPGRAGAAGAARAVMADTAPSTRASYDDPMERVAYLWDELDDLLWAARHVLRKAWHVFLDRAPFGPRDIR
jgi:hypothetical protein